MTMQTEDKYDYICKHYNVRNSIDQNNHTYVCELSRPSFDSLCNILAW